MTESRSLAIGAIRRHSPSGTSAGAQPVRSDTHTIQT